MKDDHGRLPTMGGAGDPSRGCSPSVLVERCAPAQAEAELGDAVRRDGRAGPAPRSSPAHRSRGRRWWPRPRPRRRPRGRPRRRSAASRRWWRCPRRRRRGGRSMDGPSMRCCRPCALPALRTTKASSARRRRAAACSIAVATGSAPRVRPPTASNSRSAVRSSMTSPTSGRGLAVEGDPAQVDVVVGLLARGQGDPAVHDGLGLDELEQAVAGSVADGQRRSRSRGPSVSDVQSRPARACSSRR